MGFLDEYEALGKSGEPPQQILKEQVDLLRFFTQPFIESGRIIDLEHLHTPLDTAQNGVVLVSAKVVRWRDFAMNCD